MSATEPLSPLFDEFSAVDKEEWRAKVRADLGDSFSEDLLTWNSLEGITMPAFLQRDDLDGLLHVPSDSSVPPLSEVEELPANSWRFRQSIHHPDPETVNQMAETALEGDVTDLGLCLSSRSNHDTWTSLESIDDLASVLDSLPLEAIGIHLERGPAAPVLFEALREVLSTREFNLSDLNGSLDYDPTAALASGTLRDADHAFDIAEDLVTDLQGLSSFRPVSIDVRVYHDAGASAVQELAFALGALSELLAEGTDRGLALQDVLEAVQVIVSVSTSYFVEIAKLRALRLLIPQVVEAYASEADADLSVSPQDIFVQAETSRRTETIYDPYVNMLRATTEAMAAVIGGCDVLSIRPYDASLHPPDSFATRIARNTQLILQHEAHLDQVADPAAGSYYVETLTDRLARAAWDQFQALETNGGILAALQEGSLQDQIRGTRQQRQTALNTRDAVLVGTTHYPDLDERREDDLSSPPPLTMDSSSSETLETAPLDAIRSALRGGASFPAVVSSLQTGEASIDPLPRLRLSTPIESIRLRTEHHARSHDGPPTVLLAPIGPPSIRSARATFARNFLGVAGFEVIEPLKFDSPEEAAAEAIENDADMIVLCSADAEYPELTSALQTALANRNQEALLVIAGSPENVKLDLSVDVFLHRNSPLQETLEGLQERLGVEQPPT